MAVLRRLLTFGVLLALQACARGPVEGSRGILLAAGGDLQADNTLVYSSFVSLSGGPGSRIVVATAASADEPEAGASKVRRLSGYAPQSEISVISRPTPGDQTVALVDGAGGMFFTGGDQKRVTDRYKPGGQDSPEALAMRRLLARGGVIAGTSAGDAMMSDPMFLTGGSLDALRHGAQIGPGMGFMPWAIMDSHFFERHRFGRLVAALEQSGHRLGIGVSENAAVRIDLATSRMTGVSEAASLLVDAGAAKREGLNRSGVRCHVIEAGDRFNLEALRGRAPEAAPATSVAAWLTIDRAAKGSAAAFFRSAAIRPSELRLEGYALRGVPVGGGWSEVAILVDAAEREAQGRPEAEPVAVALP
ncbi:MAG: cyanophycinase [Phycisphaerales bacterium]